MEKEDVEEMEKEEEKRKWYQVDKNMVPAKVTYFFQNGKHPLYEYMMLFYVSIGLSPSEAGVVSGMQYIGGFTGNLLWTYIADNIGHHSLILLGLSFMALITASTQPFIGWVFSPELNICPSNQTYQNSQDLVPEKTSLFYSLLVVSILFSSFESTVGSFIDVGVLLRVRNSPGGRANLGMQRYTGSLGRSLASIIYSISVQYFPAGSMNCYTGLFITYCLFNLSTNVSSQFVYKGLVMPTQEDRTKTNAVLWKYIKQLDFLHFFFSLITNGILQSLYFCFIFLYLKTLQAPTLLLGFSSTLKTVTGVIVYIFSEKIINTLRGPCNAMCFSTFMWGLRFLSTAAITNPYYILIIDLFHGFTFSLFRVSYLKYVNETTDDRICATICGLASALYRCFSPFLAEVIGGILYEKYGAKRLFSWAAAVSAGWTIVSIAYFYVRSRTAQDYEQLDNDDDDSSYDDNDHNAAADDDVDDDDDDDDDDAKARSNSQFE